LKGTAPTFYRRLQTLFFSPPSHKGYETIGGNRMQLKQVHKNPPIYVIDNFLTRSDLEYFEEKIASCPFERSFVDNMEYGEQQGGDSSENPKSKRQRRTILDTTHRTSTFFGFKKLHDTKVSALEQRIADLLGCWVHQVEALQLVRYLPGQFFGEHHDMGDLLGNDEVTLPRKQLAVKRRLVTLFCYLNSLDDDQGGCTYFPKCGGLRVTPKKGRAVLWSNVTSAGLPDPHTIHAGEAVIGNKDVTKYGLNVWICEE
jgi:prolyl 4-hydroxylase